MKKNVLKSIPTRLVFILILAICGAAIFDIKTSLVAQGAVGGDALMDASMFPVKIITLIILMLLCDIVHSFFMTPLSPNSEVIETKSNDYQTYVIIALTIIYLLLIELIGFILLTPLYLSLMFFTLKAANLLYSIIGGITTSIALYLIFQKLLNIILPIGLFRFLI